MNRGTWLRSAIIAGIVIITALVLLAVGAPMIGMIRAHLGM